MTAKTRQGFIAENIGSIVTVLIFLLTISFSTGGLWMKVSYMQKDIDEINTHLRRIKLISTVETMEGTNLWSVDGKDDYGNETEKEKDSSSERSSHDHGS